LQRSSFTLDADALVQDCPATQIGKSWPWPVHQRLEELHALARKAGDRPTRAEVLAAIVCSFEPDGEVLREALRAYRTSTVRQVALREPVQGNVVRMDRHGPGRRREGVIEGGK